VIESAVLDIRLHGQSIGTITRLPGDRNLFAFNDDTLRIRDGRP
jgi:hypothetical protein